MRRVSAKASNTVEINTPTRFESGQYLCSFINALYLPSLLDANWIPDMIIMVESTGYGRAKIRIAPPPPGVIGSLRAGFDTVAGHVWLIVLPLGLDIFLWLGPRLSVDGLLRPFVRYMFLQARRNVDVSELDRFLEAQTNFLDVLQKFNLLSLISKFRTFPIGISSLLAQTMPVNTPLGEQNVVQVSSIPLLVGIVLILTMLGWVVGGLYFRWVSGTTLGQEAGISLLRAILQTFILSV